MEVHRVSAREVQWVSRHLWLAASHVGTADAVVRMPTDIM